MIEQGDIEFFISDMGSQLLQTLSQENLSEANSLSILTKLRKSYTPRQAASALSLAKLRLQAIDKFGDDANKMFFTDNALQQASDPLVRKYRAENITGQSVLDVCCGIGADSLAFSSMGTDVLGIDIDPLRIELAKLNADALGLSSNTQFDVIDANDIVASDFSTIFFDPARRKKNGKRIYDVERYIPPLSLVRNWDASEIVVKLSPGVKLEQLQSYDGGVEFISVNGELKEAVFWLQGHGLTATLLTQDGVYHWQRTQSLEDRELSQPLQWLVESDTAIIRAGLVQDVAQAYDGHLLDETIAYFTTQDKPDSVWLRSWQILDWMPFQLKRLRTYLRERNIGRVTIKKRGSAISIQEIVPKLKLKGTNACTLVFTRCDGQHIVIICADYIP